MRLKSIVTAPPVQSRPRRHWLLDLMHGVCFRLGGYGWKETGRARVHAVAPTANRSASFHLEPAMQRTLALLAIAFDPADLDRMRQCLARAGADVTFEDLGRNPATDAVLQRLTAAGAPGLQALIVDLDPPGTPGWEILARLRTMPALASLPALALVTTSAPDEVARCSVMGVDYLVKPERSAECSALAERVLNSIDRVQEGDDD